MTEPLRAQLQATLNGSYTLERELGGGGMSRVFVAEELRLKRKVVVKVLSPELAQGISVERFEREIQTVAALQHANIVPVHTAGDTQGLPYYTMPFVEGESLRARLGRGPLPVAEVIGILRDVSKALGYAHQRGVVHRDIKPDNVLISGDVAVVTDFGIAKAISASRTASNDATLTQMGASIGTPAYMAPEQAAGDPSIDHRADLYAVGAMAYELLTGQQLFPNRTAPRMLAAHMGEAPRPITELRADLPPALAALIMQCLAKDPDARPQQASEIARALETITSSTGIPAMPAVLLGGAGMFRTAIAIYVGAFIAVAIVAKAAIVGIGLPEWVFPGALIVMAIGLPVVLWTGYVQRVARRAVAATPTYTPGGTQTLTTHGVIATMALKAAPRMSWYRTARGGMYALGVFVAMIATFMVLRATGIGPFGSLLAAGKLARTDRLLLTDFRTTGVDSALGRVVSDAVRAGLAGSSAFALVPTSAVSEAITRMQRSPTVRLDSALAREIAVRDGVKAYIDGEVTGVGTGYIVALRLVRADSGIELASFRESGDGPRGLIDAADRLARALRAKVGESLREVNTTPALAQATTASLEALQKYSEAVRANGRGERQSIELARQAVAIDSTFATAWNLLGAVLSNYGGRLSAIDSALTNAYRFRERLPEREREHVTARYFALGPGRDRPKAIAMYESLVARGDSVALVNLGEVLRSQRLYARTESLNVAALQRMPANASALGNTVDMQLNRGDIAGAERTLATIKTAVPGYPFQGLRTSWWLHNQGRYDDVRALADSLRGSADPRQQEFGRRMSTVYLLRGRVKNFYSIWLANQVPTAAEPGMPYPRPVRGPQVTVAELAMFGPSPSIAARIDSLIATTAFSEFSLADRPDLQYVTLLARSGNPAKAKLVLARYQSALATDTSFRRATEHNVHSAMGEIALAEGRWQEALAEFRRGDIGYDGLPANECGPCLPLNLARAFDAGRMPDSAAAMFERAISTPFHPRAELRFDPTWLAVMHERVAQLYDAMGDAERASKHYREFIALWKNADAELQPRVAAARRRMERLTPVERAR
ncbi:MAG: protein kinase [Gemmatimonadaceae bacterium]|nr:protein kinase [Gemmatimonadaceae bacterium]